MVVEMKQCGREGRAACGGGEDGDDGDGDDDDDDDGDDDGDDGDGDDDDDDDGDGDDDDDDDDHVVVVVDDDDPTPKARQPPCTVACTKKTTNWCQEIGETSSETSASAPSVSASYPCRASKVLHSQLRAARGASLQQQLQLLFRNWIPNPAPRPLVHSWISNPRAARSNCKCRADAEAVS